MITLATGPHPRRNKRTSAIRHRLQVALILPIVAGCMTQTQQRAHQPPKVRPPISEAWGPLPLMPTTATRPRAAPTIPYLLARPREGTPGRDRELARTRSESTVPPERLNESTTDSAAQTPPSIPRASPPQPIDLPSALKLADRVNPNIGEARIIILEALARRQSAYALLLPTLNAGTNYHNHVGVLQRSSGTILPVTEQSLYFGGGARTVAAESVGIPAVNIFSPLTDAIFEPLAAQQEVRARQTNAAFVANVTLLEVARLYLRLVGTQAVYEARRVLAASADEIAANVAAFAATGQGRRSDADRADTERRLFQTEILRAEENVAVTSALLAERLNLDPSSQLQAMNLVLEPISLIDPNTPIEPLLQTALARRPDLANRRALLAEAEWQVVEEKARPWLPTVWVSFSGGAFGGGSNLVPPTFSAVAGRTDFDARAYWTILNLGAGNAARIKQRQAQAGQAAADQARVVNEIRSAVASSLARTKAFHNKVTVARLRLQSAEDGFRQDRSRLRETLAKPIEALDSLRLLAEARIALIEATTEYNQNQFELFVALGSPPPL